MQMAKMLSLQKGFRSMVIRMLKCFSSMYGGDDDDDNDNDEMMSTMMMTRGDDHRGDDDDDSDYAVMMMMMMIVTTTVMIMMTLMMGFAYLTTSVFINRKHRQALICHHCRTVVPESHAQVSLLSAHESP